MVTIMRNSKAFYHQFGYLLSIVSCLFVCLIFLLQIIHGLRTPNEAFFPLKSRIFGLGQTNWADKLWGIWGMFGPTISTHFGTVSPLSMFSNIQPLFLQKTKLLHPHPKYLFWIGI
jgi:hypothetical protein